MTEEEEEYEEILEQAYVMFQQNERRRGGVRHQTITPQDALDYWVFIATKKKYKND